jgi:BirA family biotin operon repressor/biotin-[acetyl-CoA-carboxylase] ligase
VLLSPDVVVPRLRGGFGREYHYALEAPTTQLMLPAGARHGAVALAEHQTAGRGRRGRVWVDEPAKGLSFSIALGPPPQVGRWPELTRVAAEAVAAAIGAGASIKDPNDVLLDGRKVAGILADARDNGRVVLGIGVNVGSVPWPDAAAAGGERLELLVDILERFERGYDRWAASVTGT